MDAVNEDPTMLKPRDATGAETAGTGILAEIAAGLSSGRDLSGLLHRLLEPTIRLAGAQAGAVRALATDGQTFELVGEVGLPAGACGNTGAVERHCGHCGAAADARQIVWATDLRPCAARSSGGFFGHACQRMLVVPLLHRGRLLGVYNLFYNTGEEPTPDVMAILKSVGELLGLALDNARLEAENLRATLVRERQLLAAEVHDSIAQLLAFAKMRLPLLQEAIATHDDVHSLRYCADLRQALSEAHAGLREVLTHFRNPMDPLGLTHALEAAACRFRQRTGVELEFVNRVPDLRLAADREAQVFHIVQEALTNVAKHAQASRAWLTLSRRDDRIEIVVEDNGTGLAAGADLGGTTHLGLGIMDDRARRLDGMLAIGARQGGGTAIRLSFPVGPATMDAHA